MAAARGSGRLLGKGTAEPSQEGAKGGGPGHFYSLRRLLFEINIEEGIPTPRRTPWFSTAKGLREPSVVPTGVSAGLAQPAPSDPLRQRHAMPKCWEKGAGREGHGWPCYCWQEVAPFFPDGETEARGGLGTCPSHSQ